MRRSYGNVTIDLPSDVSIVNDTSATPIFHASREGRMESDSTWRRRTRCGLVIYSGPMRAAVELQTRHAVKFGRPCSTCWPELRVQPALFQRTPRTRLEHRQMAAV